MNIGEHPHTPPKLTALLYRLLYGHLSQRPCHRVGITIARVASLLRANQCTTDTPLL
jgi:hypothetical protein